LSEILKTVSKKPETIALIQMLSKYPNVVQALKDDNVNNLNDVEIKIYREIGTLDDNILSKIADYYSKIEPKVGDVFDDNTPDIIEDNPTVTNIDNNTLDNPTVTSIDHQDKIVDANEEYAIA